MLNEITILCRPTKDPELQTTKNGTTYVRLDLAVNKGFGDNEHVNYYTGWFKNDEDLYQEQLICFLHCIKKFSENFPIDCDKPNPGTDIL